ncbi:MAG: NUDIX hydrolase [Rhizobiales bacterium]|nr:NUDIX hydrolase [Hyphomicrobiales bacterium]
MADRQRPRDAATLILVRREASAAPRILMGQRHGTHAFMPNKYVFPGGRLDAGDSRVKPSRDLDGAVLSKLMQRMRSKPSPVRARAFAIAALRETFEETGLLFGRRNFESAPDLSALVYFARAITPPGRTRRFDSRFFVADAAHVGNLDRPLHVGSGELLTPAWFSLDETLALDLPSITKDILRRLRPFLDEGLLPDPGCPVSFQYYRGQKWVEETI